MATLTPDAAASQCRSNQTVAETTANRQHITASTTDGSQPEPPLRPRTTRKAKPVGKRNRTVTPPDMVRDPRANNEGDDDDEFGLFQFDQPSESPFAGLEKRRKTTTTTTLPTVIDTPDVDSAPIIPPIIRHNDLLPNRADAEEVNVIFADSSSAGMDLGEGTPQEPVRRQRDHRVQRLKSNIGEFCNTSLESFSFGPVYADCSSDDEY